MRHTITLNAFLFSTLTLTLTLLCSHAAHAQPASLTIDTSTGRAPEPPKPPSARPAAPAVDGQEAPGGDDMYYGDYIDAKTEDDFTGVVPATHEVRSGDTLWGLASFYFQDGFSWPKVWGLNPEITNPHWIYPGNIVRLRAQSDGLPTIAQDQNKPTLTSRPTPESPAVLALRQTSFVDADDLKNAGVLVGSVTDRALLSTGDSIYFKYSTEKDDALPAVGDRLAIYSTRHKIKRGGKSAGAYVDVVGEAKVSFVKEGQRVRATILNSVDPVERGMNVGPLTLNFSDVKPLANKTSVSGEIIDVIGPDALIGASAFVLLDRGADDGVEVGNRFLVIRSGDAYIKEMSAGQATGQQDKKYPERSIGEVMIVQAGKRASLGSVSFSMQELGVGDRVFMRGPKAE